jgi:hypothetical protein
MNRYQFEDLISDYLENKLSIPKRKEFESYLDSNSECRDIVESVKNTLNSIKLMKPVSVPDGFMDGLNRKIDIEKNKPVSSSNQGKTYFGFTPIYAGVFSVALVCSIWLGIQLLPDSQSGNPSLPFKQTPQVVIQSPKSSPHLTNPTTMNTLASSKDKDEIDSTSVTEKERKTPFPLDNKATFVKDN